MGVEESENDPNSHLTWKEVDIVQSEEMKTNHQHIFLVIEVSFSTRTAAIINH